MLAATGMPCICNGLVARAVEGNVFGRLPADAEFPEHDHEGALQGREECPVERVFIDATRHGLLHVPYPVLLYHVVEINQCSHVFCRNAVQYDAPDGRVAPAMRRFCIFDLHDGSPHPVPPASGRHRPSG